MFIRMGDMKREREREREREIKEKIRKKNPQLRRFSNL